MTTNSDKTAMGGLLEFPTEQSIFEVGGVRIGGRPGANPTVLIGSVFYHGHKVNLDEDAGSFDAEEAEKRIRVQDEHSELTGNPCMLDVVGATPQAIEKHLEFAAEVTKAPLLIDGTTVEVRLAGLEYVAKAGLADRIDTKKSCSNSLICSVTSWVACERITPSWSIRWPSLSWKKTSRQRKRNAIALSANWISSSAVADRKKQRFSLWHQIR